MEKLIQKKQTLESELQQLQQLKQQSTGNDTELFVKINNIETALKTLNTSIQMIQNKAKSDRLAIIRNTLGETFDESYYGVGGQHIDSPPIKIYKTSNQLRAEYYELLKKLDTLLETGAITDKQHELTATAINELYNEYKNNALKREIQPSASKQNIDTSNNGYDQHKHENTEDAYFDNMREKYRQHYGYDTMSSEEQLNFDNKLEETIELEKKKIKFRQKLIDQGIDVDKVDNFDELFYQEMSKTEIDEPIEIRHRIR